MPTLKEIKEKLEEKQDELAKIFAKAKNKQGEIDLSLVPELGEGDTKAKLEIIHQKEAELNALFDEYAATRKAEDEWDALKKRGDISGGMVHPAKQEDPNKPALKDFMPIGTQFIKSEGFAHYRRTKQPQQISLDWGLWELKHHVAIEKKTLFQTGAGWAPESLRLPDFTEDATRPIFLLDVYPSAATSYAAVVFMEETTRTHAAAERDEGATYAESAFAFTERSVTVRSVGDSIPVTDEQLEDVAQVETYLMNRLMFGVRQRIDGQILTGNGVAPNLLGILNHGDIQTQAKGADPTPDAIYKAMTLVRVTGRSMPNRVVMHPNDWQAIRLLRTADGIYIWGSPSEAGPERIWGLPVTQTDAETENTGLVGDFTLPMVGLYERRGIDVQVGYSGTQFVEGEKTIRADIRVANVIRRGAAFCTVTGI